MMVRVCLFFPLVLIVCVALAKDLKCYKCGEGHGPDCPGSEIPKDCYSTEKVCVTEYNFDGQLKARYCQTEAAMEKYKENHTEPAGKLCWAKRKNEEAKRCFCSTEGCNKVSSSSMTKPSVWTNLMWIGLVLVSAFSSKMRAVSLTSILPSSRDP